MTEGKFRKNIDDLRNSIARKPPDYTPEHARTFLESFNYYTNTRTINLLTAINEMLAERGWPYPSFIARETRKNVVAGVLVLLFFLSAIKHQGFFKFLIRRFQKPKEFQGFNKEDFDKQTDTTMLTFFDFYKKKIFKSWRINPIFENKQEIIKQIQVCYDKKLWIACISAAFPILDHLIRTYLRTRKLDRDINHLLGFFRNAGFTSSHFKPGYTGYDESGRKTTVYDFLQKDLRLVGIGLSSFVDNASIYYEYYRKDFMAPDSVYPLNRHAVIHSASSDFNNKENAVRLLSFIDLTLELEPAFEILLREE